MAAATFNLWQAPEFFMAYKFQGNTSIGPNFTVTLPSVLVKPSGKFDLTGDNYNKIEVSGEILADVEGSFGTLEHPDTGLTLLKQKLYIGYGIHFVMVDGVDSDFRDIGEVDMAELTPKTTTKPFWSKRGPRKFKAFEAIDSIEAEFKMEMFEHTFANMLLGMNGVAV